MARLSSVRAEQSEDEENHQGNIARNGLRMIPLELNDDQKAAVIKSIKELAPMYRSINVWIDILNTASQYYTVRRLRTMKQMIERQVDGFSLPGVIYYMTPESVSRLQGNLIKCHEYITVI
jgi:hypothetical protein